MPNPNAYVRGPPTPARYLARDQPHLSYVRKTSSFVPAPFNGGFAPMSAEYKQGVAARLPVDMSDSAGNPKIGVLFSDVTATIEYSDGTTVAVSPADAPHWVEVSSGAFLGSGTYNLIVDAGHINIPGVFIFRVKTATSSFKSYGKIVANEEADTYVNVQRAIGMLHDNSVLDQTAFDANNNLTAGRLRIYDSQAHALAAGATGLLFQYAIQATYIGVNCQSYTVTRVL